MTRTPQPYNPRIIDEFTWLPVSATRRTQLRNRRDGICINCTVPCAPFLRCPKHQVVQREYQRRRYGFKRRNLNAKSYRREHDGNT
jgi:hypothetical protein